MIIAISGSVGSGKTTLANKLGKELDFDVIHLNDWAIDFKIKDIKKLQTFDFDIDKLISKTNQYISNQKNKQKGIILEGHFAHFINPDLVDFLFIINRDLKQLKQAYKQRKYNNQKISDNLEVESFNLCFYEGIEEGYKEEKQIFCLQNDSNLNDLLKKTLNLLKIHNRK